MQTRAWAHQLASDNVEFDRSLLIGNGVTFGGDTGPPLCRTWSECATNILEKSISSRRIAAFLQPSMKRQDLPFNVDAGISNRCQTAGKILDS